MNFTQEEILARMKADLENSDNRIEGSFTMDNLLAVSEELARLATMQIQPLWDEMEKNITETITAGNERYYEYLAMQPDGADGQKIIGNARAHGVRDGSGLINISVITPESTIPSDDAIAITQAYIDTLRLVGARPIVEAGEMLDVSVSGVVQLQEGADIATVRLQAQSDLQNYLKELSFSDAETTTLNYFRVGIIISSVAGVKEVVDYTVNGAKDSLTATFSQFFTLKGLVLNVTT